MTELLGKLDAWSLDGQRPNVAAWAQGVGLDPNDVYRIDMLYDGGLVARVYEWDSDEDGRRFCPRDHRHTMDADDGGCEIATREPYDVTIIGAAGFDAIRDRMQASIDWTRHMCFALAPLIAVVREHRSAMRTEYTRRRRARARRNR